MKKEDREKNKAIKNALKEIIKSKVKEYKLKKKDYMIYGLFVDACIRETDFKPTINSYIEYR